MTVLQIVSVTLLVFLLLTIGLMLFGKFVIHAAHRHEPLWENVTTATIGITVILVVVWFVMIIWNAAANLFSAYF